jgi:hypothetical protein
MVTLQQLPIEIISQVFWHFAFDYRLLRNLALQCSYFRYAVRPILLHRVNFPSSRLRLRFELFNRTICENPELSKMVQSLSLTLREIERDARHPRDVESLLGQLTALRVLWFDSAVLNYYFEPNYLNVNPMDKLSVVTLQDWNITLDHLARYIFLENIHRLNIRGLSDLSPSKLPTPPKNLSSHSSPLAVLQFGSYIHFQESIMKEILSWPKALKRLVCTVTVRINGSFTLRCSFSKTFSLFHALYVLHLLPKFSLHRTNDISSWEITNTTVLGS